MSRKHFLSDVAVIGFGLTLAVLIVGGVLGYVNARRLDDNSRWVAHTHEVIAELEALLSTLKDAETGQRGYLLAEDEKYLQPYDDASGKVPGQLAHLKELTSDNRDQQARLAVLDKKVAVRLDELQQTVALMKKGDRPAALDIVKSGIGKAHMDDLRQDIAAMRQAEHDLLRKRADESKSSYLTTVLSILFTGIAGLVLVAVIFFLSQRNVRQRQRAAAEIAEQGERLRTTLASIGDAVIATDTEARITSMNAVAEALTGWKVEEATGRLIDAVFRIVNEATRQPVKNPALRALQEGVVVGLANHTVLIAKDGTERAIDDSAAPIRCRDGVIVGCVLVFRDVTERRRYERELGDREREFRTLAESIPQLCWMANPDGHIFWYNRRWYDYTGTTFEQMEGWGWQSVHDPDELPKVLARWRQSIASGEAFDMVFPLKGKDGVFRPFLTRILPFKDGAGRVIRWFGTNTDISELRALEGALRQSEEQARRTLEFHDTVTANMGEGMYAVDSQGLVTYMNPAAEALFGWTFEELKGRKMHDLTHHHHPDGRPFPIEECAGFQVLHEGKVLKDYDDVFIRKDGSFFPVCYSSSPLRSGERTVGLVVVFRDNTERKRAEQALRDADSRKDEFLATLAHELRGPLAPLRNMLEIMKRADGDGALIEQARATMDRQLRQMIRLIDDLLDVSRISQGKIELRRQRVELASVVYQAVEACRPLAECSKHQVNVTLPPEPIYLHADPVRLAQVLGNLLNNACKYSEPGGRIALTAERQGSDAVVTVQDLGMGIPADKLASIFEMFTQIDRTLERSQGGLGIGLTLVKRLVEMHEGTVTAHSEGPGRGSEFIVRLPVLIERPKAAMPPEPSATERQTEARRILIVDDNRDGAESLAMLLKMTGNETRTAQDGLEAVAAAERFRPEVVLLDIGMPKLNGYEACRRIREQQWGKSMVLVALTGWGQEDDRRKSAEVGFDHHLVKPVDLDALTKLLAEMQAKE